VLPRIFFLHVNICVENKPASNLSLWTRRRPRFRRGGGQICSHTDERRALQGLHGAAPASSPQCETATSRVSATCCRCGLRILFGTKYGPFLLRNPADILISPLGPSYKKGLGLSHYYHTPKHIEITFRTGLKKERPRVAVKNRLLASRGVCGIVGRSFLKERIPAVRRSFLKERIPVEVLCVVVLYTNHTFFSMNLMTIYIIYIYKEFLCSWFLMC
jgi:hypothetical protein